MKWAVEEVEGTNGPDYHVKYGEAVLFVTAIRAAAVWAVGMFNRLGTIPPKELR